MPPRKKQRFSAYQEVIDDTPLISPSKAVASSGVNVVKNGEECTIASENTTTKKYRITQSWNKNEMSKEQELLTDPWSDEQEIALLKSIIQWKPAGIHKHFRMLAIADNLRSHGFVHNESNHGVIQDDLKHLRIAGIWNKLNSLYDLKALDQRENSAFIRKFRDAGSDSEDYDSSEREEKQLVEFSLPETDFGELLVERKLRITPTINTVGGGEKLTGRTKARGSVSQNSLGDSGVPGTQEVGEANASLRAIQNRPGRRKGTSATANGRGGIRTRSSSTKNDVAATVEHESSGSDDAIADKKSGDVDVSCETVTTRSGLSRSSAKFGTGSRRRSIRQSALRN